MIFHNIFDSRPIIPNMFFSDHLKKMETIISSSILLQKSLRSDHELNQRHKFAKKTMWLYRFAHKVFGRNKIMANVLQNAWSRHLKKLIRRLYNFSTQSWFLYFRKLRNRGRCAGLEVCKNTCGPENHFESSEFSCMRISLCDCANSVKGEPCSKSLRLVQDQEFCEYFKNALLALKSRCNFPLFVLFS